MPEALAYERPGNKERDVLTLRLQPMSQRTMARCRPQQCITTSWPLPSKWEKKYDIENIPTQRANRNLVMPFKVKHPTNPKHWDDKTCLSNWIIEFFGRGFQANTHGSLRYTSMDTTGPCYFLFLDSVDEEKSQWSKSKSFEIIANGSKEEKNMKACTSCPEPRTWHLKCFKHITFGQGHWTPHTHTTLSFPYC